jgi:hypothetical protein
MVIGLPRSGTTWAANWLTTDTTICIHDPLARYMLDQLNDIDGPKMIGVACTALGFHPDWVNNHPARKVILHRPLLEVQNALEAQGFNGFQGVELMRLQGMHCDWRDLWNKPKEIYEFLLQREFDADRHSELKQMNIQVDYERLKFNKQCAEKYIDAIQRALH